MAYQILCKRIKSWGIEPLIHGIFWIFFICGEVFSLALLTGNYGSIEHYVFFYLLNIILFYSYVWLLFRIPEERSVTWLWGLIIFIVILTLYVGLAGVLTNLLNSVSYNGNPIAVYKKKFLISTSWRGFYFMLFATGFVLVKRNSRRRMNELAKVLEIERLKAQLISAEKDYLRSQINPHLLFNTLSFINYATKYDPENARVAIDLLSDIMDYALHGGKGESVLLSEEIVQIQNMIALNQLRFGDKLNMSFEVSSNHENIRIAPLILLTLVENVFKHGNLLHKTQSSHLKLLCFENILVFKTSNPADKSNFPKGAKTGLMNIQARLQNIYPEKHKFIYGIQGDLFITELTLRL